jgi:hypothetical protein
MKWLLVFLVTFLIVTLITDYALIGAVAALMMLIIFGEPIDRLLYPEHHKGDEWSSRV